ncbi:MAG: hypothetical protein QOE35_525 [Actinomycetota bacterium]
MARGERRRRRRGIPVWIDAIVGLALVAAAAFVLTGGHEEPVAASATVPVGASAVEPFGPPSLPTTTAPPATTAPAPAAPAITTASPAKAGACHPSYEGTCIPPAVADADCFGLNENGPWFVHEENVRVVGPDVFHLDVDFDGVACEGQPGLHAATG